jgi:hypothetical protein
MEINPYESPATSSAPPPPDSKRVYRWLGTILMVLSVFPYVPMTISPFVSLAMSDDPPLMLVAAGCFNGCVCAVLFFGGRWLRKKGRRTPAGEAAESPPAA